MGSNRASAERQTHETNEYNWQIAQLNNEWSAKQVDKQIAYNYDMWQKQNAYNTPSSQVARLKQAGINPYLALSQVNSGSASSANGIDAPTASEANRAINPADSMMQGAAVDTQNVQGALSNLNDSLNSYAGVQKAIADARKTNIESQYRGREMAANIRNTESRSEYMNNMNNLFKDTYDEQVTARRLANSEALASINQLFSQTAGQNILNSLNEKELNGWDDKRAADLALTGAQAFFQSTGAKKNIQDAYLSAAEALYKKAQTYNLDLNSEVLSKTMQSVVDAALKNPELIQSMIRLNEESAGEKFSSSQLNYVLSQLKGFNGPGDEKSTRLRRLIYQITGH